MQLDDGPLQRHVKGLIDTFAHDSQCDLAARFPAHLLHRTVQGIALHRLAIQPNDEVSALNAGSVGRRTVDRRHHTNHTLIQRDLDPKASEFSACVNVDIVKRARVKITRVRVQSAEHSPDGVAQQGRVIDGLHIISFDHAEYLSKEPQILDRQSVCL